MVLDFLAQRNLSREAVLAIGMDLFVNCRMASIVWLATDWIAAKTSE